jgi:hypothetical protein
MKEQIETAVPRIKFVPGDSDEARKTATGHSCETLSAIESNKQNTLPNQFKSTSWKDK